MPNNDWYEYTSEEMQHLGEEPGDILGLIMHDYEPEYGNDRNQEMRSPQPESRRAMPARDKLVSQTSRTYRNRQALPVTGERQHEGISYTSIAPVAGVRPSYFTHMGGNP